MRHSRMASQHVKSLIPGWKAFLQPIRMLEHKDRLGGQCDEHQSRGDLS